MHSLDMDLCNNVKEGAVKEMQNGQTACQKSFIIYIIGFGLSPAEAT